MKTILLRAELKDIEKIQNLANVAFRDTYKDILKPEQMDYMMNMMYSAESLRGQIEGEGKYFFFVESEEGTVGYTSIETEGTTVEGKPQFHLQKLYLLPSQHGKGYGKTAFCALMDFVDSLAPQGYRVEVNVNRYNKAVGFYEAMGLKCDRQGDFHIGNGYYMNDFICCMDK